MMEVIGATAAVDNYWRALSRVSTTTGPGLVRRSKTVQPNVAPGYSSGQIASRSNRTAQLSLSGRLHSLSVALFPLPEPEVLQVRSKGLTN